jgi:hypothetical protein
MRQAVRAPTEGADAGQSHEQVLLRLPLSRGGAPVKRDEPWATLDDVERVTGFKRTKATEIIKRLGGFKPEGSKHWRCTWPALRKYKKAQEQGSLWQENFRSSNATDTGTATSDTQTGRDDSAHSTSETMAVQQASARQAPRTGKSKAALRLASSLDAAKRARARSGAPLQRSLKQKKLPS